MTLIVNHVVREMAMSVKGNCYGLWHKCNSKVKYAKNTAMEIGKMIRGQISLMLRTAVHVVNGNNSVCLAGITGEATNSDPVTIERMHRWRTNCYVEYGMAPMIVGRRRLRAKLFIPGPRIVGPIII